MVSLVNYHIEIKFRRRHVDGSCVTGGVYRQIGIFVNVSQVNVTCTFFVTCQLVMDFSDQIVRQDDLSECVQRVVRAMRMI
jgi:hypothetical protein